VSEPGKLGHRHGSRPAFEGMGGAEYLVHRVMVGRIVFEDKHVLLERIHLGMGLGEEVLE
jgi:ribosomal protein L16/L10AE